MMKTCIPWLTLLLVACGGSARTIGLSSYASQIDGEKQWQPFFPGNRYVLYGAAKGCAISVASSLGEIEKGHGASLVGSPLGSALTVVEITDGWVHSGDEMYAALEVKTAAGETKFLKLPAGVAQSCLQPVPADLAAAQKLVGQKLVFAPWNADCREVQAVGRAPSSMLVEAEAEVTFAVESLALGPASARSLADGKSGDRVWLSLANGTLKVRADTAAQCFVPAGSPNAVRPTDPLTLVRLPKTRCEASDDEGNPHLECRTTLGLWEGVSTDTALELHAKRRTLGPVHFLNGRLVKGDRYARTVVSVTLGSAPDVRRQRLYSQLTPAIQAAMAKDGGSVRLTEPGSSDVTYRIAVELGEINIGELSTRESQETSRYKIRDDIRPNPEKPAAEQRVTSGRERVQEAETEFQNRKQEFDRQKQVLIDECNKQASKADDAWARVAGATGCAAVDALAQPSDSDLQSARAELATAESKLAGTPATITVPIMGDWSYTKKSFSRNVAGMLSISLQPINAPSPRVFQTPLVYTWDDYEVQADAPHNVEGHAPDRGPIDDPEALVPYIANAASQSITMRFRGALAEAQIEAARKAMADAGIEASKPGYETIDALAFDLVGSRLEKPLLRGGSELAAGKVLALPSDALSLGANQCLLAVAAGAENTTLALELQTQGGSHADRRQGGFVLVELCRSELPSDRVPVLELSSSAPGTTKWTIFRVRDAAGASQ